MRDGPALRKQRRAHGVRDFSPAQRSDHRHGHVDDCNAGRTRSGFVKTESRARSASPRRNSSATSASGSTKYDAYAIANASTSTEGNGQTLNGGTRPCVSHRSAAIAALSRSGAPRGTDDAAQCLVDREQHGAGDDMANRLASSCRQPRARERQDQHKTEPRAESRVRRGQQHRDEQEHRRDDRQLQCFDGREVRSRWMAHTRECAAGRKRGSAPYVRLAATHWR